jgi:hypothetical protein
MKRLALIGIIGIMTFLLFSGCATQLDVETPEGLFLSMGDYVPEVETLGIIQAHQLKWTPFFVLYDKSAIREALYEELIRKARRMNGDGITNITFYSKPSPWSVLAVPTVGIGVWVDYYVEGVVVKTR